MEQLVLETSGLKSQSHLLQAQSNIISPLYSTCNVNPYAGCCTQYTTKWQ